MAVAKEWLAQVANPGSVVWWKEHRGEDSWGVGHRLWCYFELCISEECHKSWVKACSACYFKDVYSTVLCKHLPFFFLPCFHLYISAYSSYRNFLSLLCAHCAICYAVVLLCLCVCVCAYICTCVHQSPPTVPLNYTGKRRWSRGAKEPNEKLLLI